MEKFDFPLANVLCICTNQIQSFITSFAAQYYSQHSCLSSNQKQTRTYPCSWIHRLHIRQNTCTGTHRVYCCIQPKDCRCQVYCHTRWYLQRQRNKQKRRKNDGEISWKITTNCWDLVDLSSVVDYNNLRRRPVLPSVVLFKASSYNISDNGRSNANQWFRHREPDVVYFPSLFLLLPALLHMNILTYWAWNTQV